MPMATKFKQTHTRARLVVQLLIAWFCTLLYGNVLAQHTMAFERFTPRDGLPSYSVFSSLQDSYGFLWFGTSNGLAKFDGYSFKVFSHDPADTTTLSDNRIRALFEDHSGNLWVGTPAGLNIMQGRGEAFERITSSEITPKAYRLPENDVRSIVQSADGAMWISTKGGGVSRLTLSKGTPQKIAEISHFQVDPNDNTSLMDNGAEGLLIDESGLLWVATDKGISRLDTKDPSEGFTSFSRFKTQGSIVEPPDVETICQTPDGRIWAGTASGLALFNKDDQLFELYQPFPRLGGNMNLVWCVASALDGSLYVGGVNGLGNFDPEEKTFQFSRNDPGRESSLSYNVVRSLTVDRTGILWIGTDGGGINKLNPTVKKFSGYLHQTGAGYETMHTVMSLLQHDDGSIWAGTLNGLFQFQSDESGKLVEVRQLLQEQSQSGEASILSLAEGNNGNLWVGTWGGGLKKLNSISGRSEQFRFDASKPGALGDPENEIWSLLRDSESLWVGTDNGLFRVNDLEHPHFERIGESEPSLQGRILDIEKSSVDGDIRVWLGTLNGLVELRSDLSGEIRSWKQSRSGENGITHQSITAVHHDARRNCLWLGTYGGGINQLLLDSGRVIPITKRQGLADDIVFDVVVDSDVIWVATNCGISRYQPETRESLTLDMNDGLQGDIFYVAKALSNGKMTIGGLNGFTVFNPNELTANTTPPPVVVTQFRAFDKVVATDIATSQSLRLDHAFNFFTFEFSALDFTNPGRNKYAFMLEGFDKEWRYRDATSRYASYTNLHQGRYVFKVKASNNNHFWNEEPLSIAVEIIPPIWKRWWFILGILLLTLFLISLMIWMRFRLAHQRETELAGVVAQRTAELREINTNLERLVDEKSRTLVQQEKMAVIGRLIQGMVHNLKTPLTVIKNSNVVLGKKLQKYLPLISEEDTRKEVKLLRSIEMDSELIARANDQILSIVDNLMSKSRMDQQEQVQEVNINELIQREVEFMQANPQFKHKVKKEIMLKEDLPPAQIVYASVTQSFENLVHNALDAMWQKEGASLGIVSRSDSDSVYIDVIDNGSGIPGDKLDSIFDPFFTTKPAKGEAKNQEPTGTGLGLHSCVELLKPFGGKITVKSEVGKGSTFTIVLPRVKT